MKLTLVGGTVGVRDLVESIDSVVTEDSEERDEAEVEDTVLDGNSA
jgi:hypothetical protein